MTVLPIMAPLVKPAHLRILGILFLCGAGCSSYEETRIAFDSMAGMDPRTLSEPQEASYSNKALRHGWITEAIAFGSDDVLSVYESVFGNERSSSDVAAPDEFVRESITTLVDLSGQDLERLAESAYRVSYVRSKDPQALSRAIATDLSGRIMLRRRDGPVLPGAPGLVDAGAQEYLTQARSLHKKLEAYWPGMRPQGVLGEAARKDYLATLTALADLPAASSRQERERLQLLLELERLERDDPGIQAPLRELLGRCLDSLLLHGIADSLEDQDAHVRETAIMQFWRLGGRDLLPWVLGRLEETRTDPLGRVIDPSQEVRRRLVQCIWSLDLGASEQRYGKASNAIEFLHTTATWDTERDLRFLATECLAHILDRPNEIGSHWVRDWWEGYVNKARKATDNQD